MCFGLDAIRKAFIRAHDLPPLASPRAVATTGSFARVNINVRRLPLEPVMGAALPKPRPKNSGAYPASLADQKFIGNLEKSLSLLIADSLGVNVNESERERNGIIRGQFCASDEQSLFFEVPSASCSPGLHGRR